MNRPYLLTIAIIAAFGGFLFGYDTGIISGTIGFVKEKFTLNTLMEGWYVSSALVGCIIGVVLAGECGDRFGRKFPLSLCGILLSIAAVGPIFCETYLQLVFCRILAGVGIGITSMLSPLYLSEISPAGDRGKLVALYQFAVTLGILSGYLANAYILKLNHTLFALDHSLINYLIKEEVWRGMLATTAIPAAWFFFAMLFLPESPRWLASKGEVNQSQHILTKINGQTLAQLEWERIAMALTTKTRGGWTALFAKKTRRLVCVGIALALLSQFTGINAVIYYGPKFMEQAGLKLNDALGGQVFIGLINVLATLFAIWKIDQYGRKKLMIIGVSIMCISLLIVGFLFQIDQTQRIWFLIFILVFIAAFAVGYGAVIWVLLAEIYPTPIRGKAMAVATFFLWSGTAIVGQMIPWMLAILKPSGVFFIFALCCVPVLFALKWIPETKGLSLEEIDKQHK